MSEQNPLSLFLVSGFSHTWSGRTDGGWSAWCLFIVSCRIFEVQGGGQAYASSRSGRVSLRQPSSKAKVSNVAVELGRGHTHFCRFVVVVKFVFSIFCPSVGWTCAKAK